MSEADVAGSDPTPIEVRFDSGQDVLSSYWGYLANGGLVIGNDRPLTVIAGPCQLEGAAHARMIAGRVQEICEKYEILLHIDEVVCGVGRTGTWFGYQNYGVEPDFVTMAKGVASGYAAISCTVTTEEVFQMFKADPDDPLDYFRDISTFGGCAAGPTAALENMRIIEDEGLLENTRAMGERTMNNLRALMDKHAVIGDVRGKGLFCGAELVADRKTKEPVPEKMAQAVVADCMAQGVIIGVTNRSVPGYNNTLCLSPALIATADDIDQITGAIDSALTRVFG